MSAKKFRLVSGASTNLTKVADRSSAFSSFSIINTNAAARYVKFYDSDDTPVVGTTVPVYTVKIEASTERDFDVTPSTFFKNSMWIATTANVGDSDTTAVGAGDLYIHIFYE